MLSTRTQVLDALEELYADLGAHLPSFQGNPCGQCKSCCTARGLSHHFVTDLELELLAERIGAARTDDFRRYLNRARDEEGQLEFSVCPNYDEEQKGCGVHTVRPFSCRVFGHYRPITTKMPEGCVFEGKTSDFAWADYFKAVPLIDRMRWLTREFDLFGHPGRMDGKGEFRSFNSLVCTDFFNAADPIDQAMIFSLQGDLAGALKELLRARELQKEPKSNFLSYAQGMIYGLLSRPREAVECYLAAAVEVPRANFFYYAGYHLMTLQQFQRAETVMLEGLLLDPKHSLILGGLATLATREGLIREAIVYFERAAASSPSNGFFVLRQGTLLVSIGKLERGRRKLHEASAFPGFQVEANQHLDAI